jgi:putative flippase GtrA
MATTLDYSIVVGLISLAAVPAPLATLIGCAIGGFSAFVLSRVWAFGATDGKVGVQLSRYVFVSASSALLNAGGVAALLLIPLFDDHSAWWATRALVWTIWSFPLSRDWAFAPTARPRPVRLL